MVSSPRLFGTIAGAYCSGNQIFSGNLSCPAARSALSEGDLILSLLSLIDMGLVGGLIVMVMYSSYENFVSRMDLDDGKDEKLGWLGKMDAGSLKNKVAASIVAISSIHLLRIFMDIQSIANDKLLWYVVLHLTFVLSAFVMCCIDIITKKSH